MTEIQERLATGKGKFTPLYPELGTGPVSYEDSISPEFFEAEREAIQTVLNDQNFEVVTHAEILDILQRNGSVDYAMSTAFRYAEAARTALAELGVLAHLLVEIDIYDG